MDRAAALLLRLAVALAILAAVLAAAIARSRRRAQYAPAIAMLPAELRIAAPVTAYYFTSRLCSACLETPGIVREASPEIPLIALHVHERPDLVRALGVFETPTLLLADAAGRIRYARVGNPSAAELRFYIDEARALAPGQDTDKDTGKGRARESAGAHPLASAIPRPGPRASPMGEARRP